MASKEAQDTAQPAIPRLSDDERLYPSSDGQPMAETDLHRDEMADVIAMLSQRYAAQPDVYVAGNLLIYYEEGDASARFAPDVFVVFGNAKHRRRTYRMWQEHVPPQLVMEISSRKTWVEDLGNKRAICARLKVREYFLYDPEADYLLPPLQGFALADREYLPIAANAVGQVASDVLGLHFGLDDQGLLVVRDTASGERLLRPHELNAARLEAEAGRLRAEAARLQAERRAQSLEAELQELRRKLADQGGD